MKILKLNSRGLFSVTSTSVKTTIAQYSNKKKAVNPEILKYINRLSDFLFVVARKINITKNKEILWKPGSNYKNKKRSA